MTKAIWFARHELRLAWRDFVSVVTAGKAGRGRLAVLVIAILVVFLHVFAWKTVAPYADVTFPPDHETLFMVTGSVLLAWTMMISQAMESVTRAFYARADLDLLLSSPAPTRGIFMLRMTAIGLTTSLLSLALIGPFINVLAVWGGARWLSAYLVLLALAAAGTALAIGLTVILFAAFGPRRTRFIAQVVAAVIGAAFVIGVQAVSIFAYGNLSRLDAFHSPWLTSIAPDLDSVFWLPARAAMGDLVALISVSVGCFVLFAVALSFASRHFGRFAVAAAGIAASAKRSSVPRAFRRVTAAGALRHKEWTLLLRDPWLVSQTMMQILYLIPPGLLLWRNYGDQASALTMLVPVLVMASGQLAGGLAWLTISGEDAPDLVSTAPLKWTAVLRAKIEAVIGSVAIILAPIVLALAVVSPWTAVVTIGGVLASASSATAVQMFFRAQAKRSHFRRRQTSSRLATFAEAFSSIGWAASAGLAAAGSAFAFPVAAMPLIVVAVAGTFRPRQAVL